MTLEIQVANPVALDALNNNLHQSFQSRGCDGPEGNYVSRSLYYKRGERCWSIRHHGLVLWAMEPEETQTEATGALVQSALVSLGLSDQLEM